MSENRNIARHLPLMAAEHPEEAALIVQHARAGGRYEYERYTLHALNEASDRVAHGLNRIGIARGTRTVLMVTPSFSLFALAFGLFKVGAIPVLVDPGMGLTNLRQCLAEAEPEGFIGVTKAQAARIALGWARGTVKTVVTVGPRLLWGGHTFDELMQDIGTPYAVAEMGEDDMAAISFTSGSTGAPKGAVYSHGTFNAQVESLRRDYGVQPGERDVATFPLFALFGPALGMAAVIPDMDATRPAQARPENLVAAVHDQQATNMFASPALIDVLGRHGERTKDKLPTLKRVVSSGAPADPASIKRFREMLPEDAAVYPSYGATEALPIAFIESRELFETAPQTDEGRGVCVGKPVHDAEVHIIPVTDAPIGEWSEDLPLPQGHWGEIAVRGPMVTREYFNRPESTLLSKIHVPGGGVFHRMGDIGWFDEQGRLWMCGRKSQRVILKDRTLYTIPVERIFNTNPQVRRSALVGVIRNGVTEPVLCVETEEQLDESARDKLRSELLELAKANGMTEPIGHILFHPRFPVDIRHNTKIFREELAEWAAKEVPR